MKKINLLFLFLIPVMVCFPQQNSNNGESYLNPSLLPEKRAALLLKEMKLEEKTAQLMSYGIDMLYDSSGYDKPGMEKILANGIGQLRDHHLLDIDKSVKIHNGMQKYIIENTRLGIPAIIHGEGLHGYVGFDATSFPQALALSSSWNIDLIHDVFTVVAKETRSRGVHQLLTPVLDIARDPRWGRFSETYGEDPYLTAEIGKTVVNAFQGEGETYLDDNHVISTLKHFPAHGTARGGFNCAPPVLFERELREVFMYPFQQCIQEANAGSVMAMYGEIDGVPVHTSEWILKDILREEWEFDGYIVSDYAAIELLTTGHQWEFYRHHVAKDSLEAAVMAINAGVNQELMNPYAYGALADLVRNGRIPEESIDEMVYPILEYKFKLGLFENPYTDEKNAVKVSMTPAHDSLALEAALQSIVMLKNEADVLPLNMGAMKKIAVIGPNANRKLLGDYSTDRPKYFVTVLDGMKNLAGNNIEIQYHEGCRIMPKTGMNKDQLEQNKKLISEAVDVASKSDAVILVLGGDRTTAREGRDRSELSLVGLQEELALEIAKTGKPVVLCLIGGIPYAIPEVYKAVDGVFQCWNLGQETGNALAAVIAGEYNPSGKLTITIPKSVGHLPAYYNKKPSLYMRAYLYDKEEGGYLYPFGHGLSYTSFDISNLTLIKDTITTEEPLEVSVEVTNTGNRAGVEVIQLYIHDKVSSVTRPMRELKGFQRVELTAGETRKVSLTLDTEQLAFYNREMEFVVESGEFELMVGNSSEDSDLLKKVFWIEK